MPREEKNIRVIGSGSRLAGGVLIGLLTLLAVSSLLRMRQHNRLEEDFRLFQAKAVDSAFDAIIQDFERRQQSLLKEARNLAEEPELVASLESYTNSDDPASLEWLIRRFMAYRVSERIAVELYTSAPRLVAWKGFSMPLGETPASPSFLEGVKIEFIHDADVREALVVWQPVVTEGRAIGAVRAIRLVGVKMPVENQFLESYSLSDDWRRMTGLSVRVKLGAHTSITENTTDQGKELALFDLFGHPVGSVYVPFPSVEELASAIDLKYGGLQSFGVACILLFLIAWFRKRTYAAVNDSPTTSMLRHSIQFGALTLAWWGTRFALLAMDVPGRWQRGKAPLAPLFDPTHFASNFGGGLMRSMGDMFTTAVFLTIFAVWLFRYATGITRYFKDRSATIAPAFSLTLLTGAVAAGTFAALFLTYILSSVVNHAVLDSTLDYFARTGFLPDRLVFFVFCSLLLMAVGIAIGIVSIVWVVAQFCTRNWPRRWRSYSVWTAVGVVTVVAFLGILAGFLPFDSLSILVAVGFLVTGWMLVVFAIERPQAVLEWIHFRAALLAVLLLTLPLYVLLYRSMDTQLRFRMIEAAGVFDTDRDSRVIFAIEQVLYRADRDGSLQVSLKERGEDTGPEARLDSLAEQLFRGSSLAQLNTYDVSITLFDNRNISAGRYLESDQDQPAAAVERADRIEFDLLKSMFAESRSDSILVEKVTGRLEPDRFQYEGLGPIRHEDNRVGWIMVRVEPKTILRDEGTFFLKVLLPTGVSQAREDFSLAEFQDRVLVRSLGVEFGLYRLPDRLYESLLRRPELWQVQRIGDTEYLTYYRRRFRDPFAEVEPQVTPSLSETITAVRAPLIKFFDHLYYLLRMAVAGLVIGAPLYLLSRLGWLRRHRWRRHRFRFKDRVLNAFLVVGLLAVGIVGVVGLRVVTAENENASQSWIRSQLERVEESLVLEADFGELPSGVLDRTNISVLAEQVGLDLNVYRDIRLWKTSRQQLIRDRLIDERLPIEAYQALMYEGVRHAYTHERFGAFEYMTGFRVLPDREGNAKYIISVPTLPEQERIEEERARTVAYLFGALLLMVIAVMLTASLLANALSRPIGRLRRGLEAVAQGRFEQALPVETRDEIGELVQTFNQMQSQLADSRRQLARQERQLAWREMARQVAHEIKNPLTPMKLSVQHLRRAFAGLNPASGDDAVSKFRDLFERITSTLIEQVDTLARIANEFSSFGRLPKRVLEPLDLNAVLQEAVDLMQEQVEAEILIDLHPEPLVLRADREELRRIYINLIKNAFEATPEDRICRVWLTTTRETSGDGEGAWAASTVSDEGSGISEEMRSRIFEPNFSSKTSGTGLGLAIVKKSVEDLQGEIGFDTRENAGTTFWIRFPLTSD